MPERSGYAAGLPSWSEVSTPHLDASKAFYGDLFGWHFEASPEEYGGYTWCVRNGKRVAGMMPIRPFSHQEPGWNVYIASDDVDATCNAAAAAGGMIRTGPLRIVTHGSMVVADDPTGAAVRFWQAGNHRGAELVAEPGAVVWYELLTPDPRASDEFYQAVFPYELKQLPQAEGADHVKYMIDGRPAAGRLQMVGDWPDRRQARWVTFFQVSGIETTLRRVGDLGGTHVHGPKDLGYGPFAICRDPFGASFAILVPEAPRS